VSVNTGCSRYIRLVKQVKQSRYRPELAYRVDRGIALPFLALGARRGWVVSTTPQPLYPQERPGTHCTGSWVGPRASLDVCEKSPPSPGFDPWTVQLIASLYTDWDTRPTHMSSSHIIYIYVQFNKLTSSLFALCWISSAFAQLVEALRYKLEGCRFDSRWCHWDFSLTSSFRPHYDPRGWPSL
jgi:hypothetical protein